jgi:hypothetical protein
MTALHSQQLALAEGSFRVLYTRGQRLLVVIHAPVTPLGSLHLAFEVHRGLESHGLPPHGMQVAGFFDDIGRFAENAVNTVSKAVTTVARPIFDGAKGAASFLMDGIAKATPFLPEKARKDIAAAARTVARAKLGDVNAKEFIRFWADAAKKGLAGAQKIGNALLDGARLVSRIVDVPVQLLGKVPVVGDVVKFLSPYHRFDKMAGALQKGDFRQIGEMVKSDLRLVGSAASLIPGVGQGVNSGLSAGLAALETGRPLDIAVKAAYGAIPIPPGVRNVTDVVLEAVLTLAHTGNLAETAIAGARTKVPAGLPRDVFDTLIRIVMQKGGGGGAPHPILAEAQRIAKLGQDMTRALPAPRPVPVFRAPKLPALPNAVKILPIFRQIAVSGEAAEYSVGGEEPIAYAVAGEVFAVRGDEPVAVGGFEDELEVGGEDPIAYAVAGESEAIDVGGEEERELAVGAVLAPEMLASFATMDWCSTRAPHAGSAG